MVNGVYFFEGNFIIISVNTWAACVNKVFNIEVSTIFKDIKERIILEDQMERIYNTANIKYAFFDRKKDAFDWLNQKGYTVR